MAKLIEKNGYWYLQYSYKVNNSQKTIEKYLGREVPKNILKIREEFIEDVFRNRFGSSLDLIQKKFLEEYKNYSSSVKEKFLSQFAIKFTYNSQAIEGSTLNLKDTALLIEQGVTPRKKYEDVELAKTHYEIFMEILKENKEISYDLIIDWHKRLFSNTYPDIAGVIRNHPVRVIGSKSIFTHYMKINLELEEFFNWYNKHKNSIHPVRLAALCHLKFVSIHPFSDGNGRISRLLMNYILHRNNFPLIDIDYSKRRSYYNSLEKDQVNQREYHFVDYIAKKFIKDYEEYL